MAYDFTLASSLKYGDVYILSAKRICALTKLNGLGGLEIDSLAGGNDNILLLTNSRFGYSASKSSTPGVTHGGDNDHKCLSSKSISPQRLFVISSSKELIPIKIEEVPIGMHRVCCFSAGKNTFALCSNLDYTSLVDTSNNGGATSTNSSKAEKCSFRDSLVLKKGKVPIIEGAQLVGMTLTACVAVETSGTLYTWGTGFSGELGRGSYNPISRVPKAVKTLIGKKVVNISCGHSHMLAVLQDKRCFSWGDNYCGQLGIGKRCAFSDIPELITGLSHCNIIEVSAGWAHSVAVDSAGRVHAWGLNTTGQLGLGDTSSRFAPAPMLEFTEQLQQQAFVKTACAGSSFSLFLTREGIPLLTGSIVRLAGTDNMIVSRICCSYESLLLFAPARITEISPSIIPLEGGTRIRIYATGLHFESAREEPQRLQVMFDWVQHSSKQAMIVAANIKRSSPEVLYLEVIAPSIEYLQDSCNQIKSELSNKQETSLPNNPSDFAPETEVISNTNPFCTELSRNKIPAVYKFRTKISFDMGYTWSAVSSTGNVYYTTFPTDIIAVRPSNVTSKGGDRFEILLREAVGAGLPNNTIFVRFVLKQKSQTRELDNDTIYTPATLSNDNRRVLCEAPSSSSLMLNTKMLVDVSLDGQKFTESYASLYIADLEILDVSPKCGPASHATEIFLKSATVVPSDVCYVKAYADANMRLELATIQATANADTGFISFVLPPINEIKHIADCGQQNLPTSEKAEVACALADYSKAHFKVTINGYSYVSCPCPFLIYWDFSAGNTTALHQKESGEYIVVPLNEVIPPKGFLTVELKELNKAIKTIYIRFSMHKAIDDGSADLISKCQDGNAICSTLTSQVQWVVSAAATHDPIPDYVVEEPSSELAIAFIKFAIPEVPEEIPTESDTDSKTFWLCEFQLSANDQHYVSVHTSSPVRLSRCFSCIREK